MALILGNFYSKTFPSWPQVVGVYSVNLPKKGHIVDFFKPYPGKSFDKIQQEQLHSSRVYLIPWEKTDSFIFSTFTFLIYQIRLFFLLLRLTKQNNYNLFQVRDEIFSGITTLVFSKLLNKKYVFNYSFFFYEGIFEAYKEGAKISKIKLYSFNIQDIILKKVILVHSSYILVISKEMLAELSKLGIPKHKMLPFTEGVEPTLFKTNSHFTNLKKELGFSDNDFIITYIGSLSTSRGIELILDSFKMMYKDYPKTKLLLVGSGNDYDNLRNIATKNGIIKSVVFTGQVPYLDVPNYIAISDVCLSIIKPLRSFYVSSPCKIFEYMIMGKPVIANREIPEHNRILSESDSGFLISYNSRQLRDAIIESIKRSTDLEKMGKNGKTWVTENRTFKQIAKALEEVYFTLLETIH
jgi:glycosyltransferase involved in cell wall biosynthesis